LRLWSGMNLNTIYSLKTIKLKKIAIMYLFFSQENSKNALEFYFRPMRNSHDTAISIRRFNHSPINDLTNTHNSRRTPRFNSLYTYLTDTRCQVDKIVGK
jgi:hypothetical protein